MKKIFKIGIIAASALLAAPVLAVSIENPLSAQDFITFLNNLLTFAIQLAIPVATIMLIVAGFYYITAQGEQNKVETAHTIVKWVLIGLLIVLCAKGIVDFMRNNIFN